MSSIIRIKRSTQAGNPTTLGTGELAYSAADYSAVAGGGKLYIGIGAETNGNALEHIVIGGKYFTDMMDHAPGTLTASSAIITDSNNKIDNLKVDNLDFNSNTISSTNSNGNITLDPAGSGYVEVVGTNGLVIPVGTTAQQGPAVAGAIRLNSETGQFEGYSGTNWASLGGVRSVDGLTYISAELTPANSDDTLRFYTNGSLRMSLDTNSLDIDSSISNVNINATTASTSSTTGALVVSGGVGIAGDLNIGGNTIITGTVEYNDDITVNGGDIYSSAATFNLLNKDSSASITNDGPTTVNAFLNATAIALGASTGTTTVNNNANIKGSLDVDTNLNVDGTAQIDGNVTVGASGSRSSLTVYGTSVNITGSNTTTVGVEAATGSTITFELKATNAVGDANLDINVDDAATLDANTISFDALDNSNFSVTANSAATKSLTLDAVNTGTGAAQISIGSSNTDEVAVTSGTKTTLNSSEVQVTVSAFNVDANSVDITTTGAGNSVTLTSLATTINADTITLRGTEGSGDTATVNLAGQLNVDNVRIDGNTISTTDGSNTLYLDPAPSGTQGLVVIEGNLQVNGTQTTINSTTVTIDDPIFVLGGDTPPESDDSLDRGIEFNWHNGTSAKLGFFGYDDSASEFIFVPDATDTSGIISGTNGNAAFGKIRLTDTTASTTTTSGAFTVAGGVGISGQLNVGGTTNKFTSTQASSSTTTGALVIAGGVGIGGSIYIGDDIIGAGAATSKLDGFEIDGGTY